MKCLTIFYVKAKRISLVCRLMISPRDGSRLITVTSFAAIMLIICLQLTFCLLNTQVNKRPCKTVKAVFL